MGARDAAYKHHNRCTRENRVTGNGEDINENLPMLQ